ncbi:hypothetical protein Bca52824_057240 [Brassica carinata]|uniref:Uncharacterized protein n=1 Tax=Brassica carinata TaxID=52824 RepID=A0A8X7QQ94_BRACI|nr:hypothetical protein Bca52824_057240 [Brassica carinata]
MGLEVEDLPAENIIKVMYERRPWKWTMDCWEVTGTKVNTKPKVVTPSRRPKRWLCWRRRRRRRKTIQDLEESS